MLVACAAFFLPPAAGLLARQHMPGVWLTSALCAVAVCWLLSEPVAFGAALESVILAVIAVAVSRPHPPSPRKIRRQEDREVDAEVDAFRREVDADPDLVGRVWNAPRPRVKRTPGPGTAP